MKKSSKKKSESEQKTMRDGVAAIGIDLSDRTGKFYAIDDEGKKIAEGTVALRTPELEKWAMSIARTVIAIEAGTHSPWISRLLTRVWARGDRGQSGEGGVDHAERAEDRSGGRRVPGATGAVRSRAVVSDSASRRASADRSAGDPHARHGREGEIDS